METTIPTSSDMQSYWFTTTDQTIISRISRVHFWADCMNHSEFEIDFMGWLPSDKKLFSFDKKSFCFEKNEKNKRRLDFICDKNGHYYCQLSKNTIKSHVYNNYPYLKPNWTIFYTIIVQFCLAREKQFDRIWTFSIKILFFLPSFMLLFQIPKLCKSIHTLTFVQTFIGECLIIATQHPTWLLSFFRPFPLLNKPSHPVLNFFKFNLFRFLASGAPPYLIPHQIIIHLNKT